MLKTNQIMLTLQNFLGFAIQSFLFWKVRELENFEAVFLGGVLPPLEAHIWQGAEIVTLGFSKLKLFACLFQVNFGQTLWNRGREAYIYNKFFVQHNC